MDKKLILLVEDNPDDEALAMRALAKTNVAHEVIVARDGAEALVRLSVGESDEVVRLPDVILLDLKLPKVDGLEVLRRIRADRRMRFIPIVVLSSSDETKDVSESYRLGANSYIRKPVDFAQFTDVVRQLGSYWLLLNEVPSPGGKP